MPYDLIPEGKYQAIAEAAALKKSKNAGTDYAEVAFRIQGGDEDDKVAWWKGYFTDKTIERTMESLAAVGMTDISKVEEEIPEAKRVVQIVIKHEEYEGKTYARVAWVNGGGGVKISDEGKMTESEKAAFARRINALSGKAQPAPTKKTTAPVKAAAAKPATRPVEEDEEQPF